MTVTGTALPRTDIETPSPVLVMSSVDIQRSGLTTITDVIRSISVDNSGSIPTAFTAGFAAGSAGVALRGLTVNSTLVLIDGRRAASYPLADDGQRSFVDLNTIPLASVDRIEVLKDGASSLYGADAIAGVVNIILKHDYSGASGSAEFGTSEHGGGAHQRVTAMFGTGDLATDRYNAYVSFEYQNDRRILSSQRDFPFNTQDLSSIGGNNANGGQPGVFPFGSIVGTVTPGTLGTPGDLTTGIPLPGALAQPLRACVPGTTFVDDPTNTLGGGAGSYCVQNFAPSQDIQPAQQRIGIDGRFTVKLNDYTEAYVNASYFQNKVRTSSFFTGPAQIQNSTPHNTDAIALPPTLPDGSLNPNNPFAALGQYALINYAFGDIPGGQQLFNHALRVVGGVRGTFGDWTYDTALVIEHTWLNDRIKGLISYAALIDAITNGTYNFIDPSQNSPAVRQALSPGVAKTSTSDLDSLDFRIHRSLWNLSGGAVGLALGAEVRREAQNDLDLNPNLEFQGLGVAHTIGSRNVVGVYGELDLPVLDSLEIDASARFDHYSTFGDTVNPKVGFKWTPWEIIALRGTYSRGFRAPSFSESATSSSEGFITYTITDPAFLAAHSHNGYTAPYALALLSSANPNVRPERSTSGTLGLIFQPLNWFNASLDYYAIRKTGVIVPGDPNTALAAYFAGQPLPPNYVITPDVPDPQFPTALPRPIVVSSPYVNANSLRTDGVDLDLRLSFDFFRGLHFVSDLTATKIFNWTMRFPDGSVQHYVGTQGPYILSSGAGTPRYRAGWSNTLTAGPLTATGTIYYTSGLFMSAPDVSGDGVCFSTNSLTGANFPPNCRMPSFTYVDLTGSYNVTPQIQVTGAILNLFDRSPPLDPINYAGYFNYNPTYSQAGIVGRFYKVGVNFKF